MNWKLALLPILIASAAPAAYAEPWLCTDADGNKAFSYEPESAHRKNCVDHPIPSGNVWRRHRASEWDAQEAPTAFPKVSGKVQRQRDAARRKILEHELAEEKKSLAAAIQELAELKQAHVISARSPVRADLKTYEDRIRVHQTNIANLQKELGQEG